MDSIIAMIEGGSVIVVAVLCCIFFGATLKRSFWLGGLVYGVVFAVTGAIVMSNSIEIIPGVRTDPRNAVAALSGAIGGPLSALISAAVMMLIRLSYGGMGAVPGAAAIGSAAVASVLLWGWWAMWRGREPSKEYIFYQALAAATVPTLTIFFLSSVPMDVFIRSASLFAPTNFLAVLLLGGLIVSEQQRRWAIGSNAEKEAQLVAVANNAPGMLFQLTLDPQGRLHFLYVSGGSRRVFGIPRETFLASPNFLYTLLGEEDGQRLRTLLATSAETGNRWSLEVTYIHPLNHRVWLQLTAEPRLDSQERLVWDGSIFDITNQKRNEAMKNEFVATVSHELRTPLTSIHGALSLLSSGAQGDLPAPTRRLLSLALHNSERLKNLINDILDIEKIESGSMPFMISSHPLDPLIVQAIEANANFGTAEGVDVRFENGAPGAAALIDPERFNQIIDNLLSNALKFSPAGGRVVVGLKRDGHRVRISVSDDGPGIPASFQPRLFEKFEQLESVDNRSKGGTGLGLSICKALVERMDGSITFETQPGKGTTFIVEFPAVEALPQRDEAERRSAGLAGTSFQVLCIGTSADFSVGINEPVSAGTVIEQVCSQEAALNKLSSTDFDLVVRGAGFSEQAWESVQPAIPDSTVVVELSARGHSCDLTDILATVLKQKITDGAEDDRQEPLGKIQATQV
ncbi:sensor histidine kinase [Notoacmeibacter ruber]|uniref:histidine kinase n=1 Tax=Notoacmeibacter ruber TaxID=2670375 RepID=A0A3L7J913_9HYPH|nr:sensor histidine kinase [Notoacmeibacter ruber]RLQ87217.1 hypothetical protein D8780_02320 [Notoacmeibacter ruber]